MPELARILSPVDFSNQSRVAAERATAMAKALEAELVLVHVLSEPVLSLEEGGGYTAPRLVEDYAQEMARRLEAEAASLGGQVAIATKILRGPIHEAIVNAARALRADMIIMGTHGRTGIPHLLLGSVAERVVRLSEVPVMTIRVR